LIGSASFVLYLLMSRLGKAVDPAQIMATFRSFFALLAALFLLLLAAAKSARHPKDTRWPLVMIVGFAALFRLALLQQTPWLSNDIYRYLWDAQLVDHGVNPYALPPAAEELSRFRDATIYPPMDHKNVHSVYPPLLQLLFWAGRKASQAFDLQFFVGLKFIFLLIDAGLVFALFRLLAQLNLDPRWAILYAWHPLPNIEIAGSGHTDGAGALTLILTIIFLLRRKYFFAVIFLALGFSVKFIPVLFLPFLFLMVGKELGLKKAGQMAAVFVILSVASYAPFMAAGEKLWSGLLVYSDKWRFNDGFFALVFSGIHRLLPDGLVQALMIPSSWEINDTVMATRRIDLALIISKTICGGIFAFLYLRLLWRTFKAKNADALEWIIVLISILAAFFLLSPTLQPWYLLWLLPLLCLGGILDQHKIFLRLMLPLWIFSVTVFLSYFVLENYFQSGVWQQPGWVKWVEYGIPFGVWLWISGRVFKKASPTGA
jgi:hypothetical protein